MTLTDAYRTWERLQPQRDEACCPMAHYRQSGGYRFLARPDDEVCPREAAWRKVVRLRDNDPKWPLELTIVYGE